MLYLHSTESNYYRYLTSVLFGNELPIQVSQNIPADILQTDESESAIIIIDLIQNKIHAIQVLQSLSSGALHNRRIRIILISSLLTWCGDKNKSIIADINTEVNSRVPIESFVECYQLETSFLSLISDTIEVVIVGKGLLYGHEGFDLQTILKALFTESKIMPIIDPLERKFPLLFIDDFCRLVSTLAVAEVVEASYVPAIDSSDATLRDTLRCLATALGVSNLHFASPDQCFEFALEDPLLVSMFFSHLQFSSLLPLHETLDYSMPRGITSDTVNDLVAEYKAKNHLQPCTLAIVGAPLIGKTSLAKQIAAKFDLAYVDVAASVKSVVNAAAEDLAAGAEMSPSQALAQALRGEIIATIKGGYSGNMKELHTLVTEAFLKTLSAELLKKCVAYHIATDNTAQMKGFVLDAWSVSAGSVLSTLNDLKALTTPLVFDAQTKSYAPAAAGVCSRVELVIELLVNDISLLSKRYLKTVGHAETPAAKLPKDIQAQAKSVDASITSYHQKMTSVESALVLHHERIEELACSSHDNVKGIGADQSSRVLRVLCEGVEETVLLSSVLTSIQTLRGPLGWITPDSESTGSNAVVTEFSPAEVIAAPVAMPLSADNAKFELLSVQVNQLDTDLRSKLLTSTDKLIESLLDDVLPQVAEAYVKISIDRPADPVQFITDFLFAKGIKMEHAARDNAEAAFNHSLVQAKEREKLQRAPLLATTASDAR